MEPKSEIEVLQAQVRDVQDKLNTIQLLLMQKAQTENLLGDWVDEDTVIALTGLKKTRLYQLRVEGKIESSTLGGKAVFYRLSDFKALLNKNRNRK